MFIRGGYMAITTNPDGMGLLRLLVADGPKFPDLVDYSSPSRRRRAKRPSTRR
jgi:hypothetical protein